MPFDSRKHQKKRQNNRPADGVDFEIEHSSAKDMRSCTPLFSDQTPMILLHTSSFNSYPGFFIYYCAKGELNWAISWTARRALPDRARLFMRL